jgi:hypothetical protein
LIDITVEEAEAALQAALEADDGLDAIVVTTSMQANHASLELLKAARDTRDQIKPVRRKLSRRRKPTWTRVTALKRCCLC